MGGRKAVFTFNRNEMIVIRLKLEQGHEYQTKMR